MLISSLMNGALLLLLVLVLVLAIVLFNGLVAARNRVRAAWSDIDVQLTRRHDLVPQLVAAVQGYAAHEQAIVQRVTELRTRAMAAASVPEKALREGELADQVGRLLVLQERYPELKASDNFLALQKELVSIEDHLQYARRFYNGAVQALNTLIETFPSLIVARAAGFRLADYYRRDGEQAPPR